MNKQIFLATVSAISRFLWKIGGALTGILTGLLVMLRNNSKVDMQLFLLIILLAAIATITFFIVGEVTFKKGNKDIFTIWDERYQLTKKLARANTLDAGLLDTPLYVLFISFLVYYFIHG